MTKTERRCKMKFNPEEKTTTTPVADGDYDFTLTDAAEKISKGGNNMIEITLEVEVGRAGPYTIFDRLLSIPASLWRLEQFCAAVSPPLNYAAGEVEAQTCIGLSGRAHLSLGDPSPNGKRFMKVDRYLPRSKNTSAPSEPSSDPPF